MKNGIVLKNENKIVFLILDGVGDIMDANSMTPLQAARKPNIDTLAMEKGILGRLIPVDVGVTPGSGPSHLSLFGYDPLEYEIGRGILEVLGLDMELQGGDIAARANFCTIQNGIVTDRRAGRIETEETIRLCRRISEEIPRIDDLEVQIKPGKSHRFGLIFRGKELSDKLTDADPHKENMPFVFVNPKEDGARETAEKVNRFIEKSLNLLKHEKRANGILLRGFSKKPEIPSFQFVYSLRALAIASYPMYRGIAKLLGMEVKEEPKDYGDMLRILKDNYGSYDFFFLHIKETDLAGEDGNFEKKKTVIEEVDKFIPEIMNLNPHVFVVTGDHSTPCALKGHSWHPVPVLLVTKTGERDGLTFHEKNCLYGSIGTLYSKNLMKLVLAHSFRLDKFGA